MILVDIYVPSVGRVYDFHLNEKSKVSIVIDEIAEIVSQKEHAPLNGDYSKLILCEYSSHKVLERDCSLEKLGIKTGEKLLLI